MGFKILKYELKMQQNFTTTIILFYNSVIIFYTHRIDKPVKRPVSLPYGIKGGCNCSRSVGVIGFS